MTFEIEICLAAGFLGSYSLYRLCWVVHVLHGLKGKKLEDPTARWVGRAAVGRHCLEIWLIVRAFFWAMGAM